MGKTKISWATYTNNIVHGCAKPAAIPEAGQAIYRELGIPFDPKWTEPGTSPECIRCYAETLSRKNEWTPKAWLEAFEEENVQLHPERFRVFSSVAVINPKLRPSERERFFVCSMGDIFHRCVPDQFLREAWAVMLRYAHIYMLLTKRIDRAADWGAPWPENFWLGTTVGHPATKWRLEYLRRSRAQVRFVSMEPLLASMLPIDLDGIHQVIVGGESGNGFRPMNMKWVLEIRDECARQGVAFFFKQAAAYRTEQRPWIVEQDGTLLQYHQYPGELTPPAVVSNPEVGLNIIG